MIRLKHIAVLVMLYNFTISSASDDKLQISGELRPRVLVDNGYKSPKTTKENTPVYTTQRTRLNALFSNEKFDIYLSLQDVRLWGGGNNYNARGVYGNTESVSLHQAWAQLNITEALSLKIGRQIFSYDDQRILSRRNWNDYQVSYDAILAEYKTSKHHFHLGLSYNSENKTDLSYPSEKFKTLNFLHYQYKLDNLKLSGIAVVTGNTLADTSEVIFLKATYGANINYTTDKTNAHLSAYYQHHMNNNRDKISAFCISAYLEQNFIKQLSFGLGLDYLSGNNDNSTSTSNNRFDILYGRRHGWYGHMDYFSTTPQQGLQDYMAKMTYKPAHNIAIELHGHYFKLAADLYDSQNIHKKMSAKLGQEVDLIMKWKFHKMGNLECGYALYKTTSTLTSLKGVDNAGLKTPQYCYLMLTVKPLMKF